jgi:formate C-acetyltransferase
MNFEAWKGFKLGNYCDEIDVRNFIQLNYTPYEGNSDFLSGSTKRTDKSRA